MFRKAPRELAIALRVTLVLAAVCGLVYPLAMTGIAQGLFNSQANGGLIKNASGTVVGANLIGQCFYEASGNPRAYTETTYRGQAFYTVDPRYFQGRPSYTVATSSSGAEEVVPLSPPCDAASSTGSNIGPSNALLIARVDTYAEYLHCAGVGSAAPLTRVSLAQLQQAVTDPTHDCLSTAASASALPSDLVTGDFTSFDPDISQASALAQVDMVAAARGISPSRLTQLVDGNVTGRVLWIFGEPVVNVLQLNLALDRQFGQPPPLG